MKYSVPIRNNDTGETRVYQSDEEWDEGTVYQWSEGNYGCDCNRALLFERAISSDETAAWEQDCGDSMFSVDYIDVGGRKQPIDKYR